MLSLLRRCESVSPGVQAYYAVHVPTSIYYVCTSYVHYNRNQVADARLLRLCLLPEVVELLWRCLVLTLAHKAGLLCVSRVEIVLTTAWGKKEKR